jgi:hypothetical protein
MSGTRAWATVSVPNVRDGTSVQSTDRRRRASACYSSTTWAAARSQSIRSRDSLVRGRRGRQGLAHVRAESVRHGWPRTARNRASAGTLERRAELHGSCDDLVHVLDVDVEE